METVWPEGPLNIKTDSALQVCLFNACLSIWFSIMRLKPDCCSGAGTTENVPPTIRVNTHFLNPFNRVNKHQNTSFKAQPHKICLSKYATPPTTTQGGLICEVIYLQQECYLATPNAAVIACSEEHTFSAATYIYTLSQIHKAMQKSCITEQFHPSRSIPHSYDDILFAVHVIASHSIKFK